MLIKYNNISNCCCGGYLQKGYRMRDHFDYRKEVKPMVTYSELMQFVVMLVAVIKLCLWLSDKRK